MTRLTTHRDECASSRGRVARELETVQQKLDRLVDALADGSMPAEEIKVRLNAEKTRKTRLATELEQLDQVARVTSVDTDQLKQELRTRVNDVSALLGRRTPQARQMLRKLLTDKIELEPVGEGRDRGYRFRGALTVDKLIGGDALITHLSMVAPTGFEPVFQP
jgi:ABC-type transporter Mla subunit MlaD